MKKRFFNNVIVIIISQVLVKLLGVLYKLYLANKDSFGDAGNAIYNSGYQIYALLLTVSSVGVPNAIAKVMAECEKKGEDTSQILSASLVTFSIMGLVGSLILIIFSKYIAYNILSIPESRLSIIALAPSVFNVCLLSVWRGYYNGTKKIDITAKSQTIEQMMKTIFTIVLVEISYVWCMKNTEYMAAFANIATTLATLCGLVYLHKKANIRKFRYKVDGKKIKEILMVSIPISCSSILASLNRNIDSVTIVRFLRRFVGENVAKIQYGILCGKVDVLVSVPVSFVIAITTIIIPSISSIETKNNMSSVNNLVNKYLQNTIIFVVPCCIAIIVFSKQILYFLYNNENGYILLQISAVSIIFISLEQIVHTVLQAIGKIFIPAIALSIGVVTKAVLNVYFLNVHPGLHWYGGITGCCIATLVCHVITLCISYSVMKVRTKINFKILKFVLKPILASCIMALCLYYTHFLLRGIIMEKLAIILAVLVATMVYIMLIFLFKITEHKNIYTEFISKK